MNLEQQIISLEISKRLEELGIKQESLFMWALDSKGHAMEIRLKRKVSFERSEYAYSAFTVAELGKMLPRGFIVIKGEDGFHVGFQNDIWQDSWYDKNMFLSQRDLFNLTNSDTEADARGKMLIYLLENNLITL